jgi:hypothetical protein
MLYVFKICFRWLREEDVSKQLGLFRRIVRFALGVRVLYVWYGAS